VSATQNVAAAAVSSARVDVSRSGWEEKAAFALQLGAGVAPGGTGVVEFSESCCGSKTEHREAELFARKYVGDPTFNLHSFFGMSEWLQL
jgi:hypothetical protein